MLALLFTLEGLCAIAGAAAAFLFVFSAYGNENKSKTYADIPRVRNFGAMLSVGLVTFIADWNKISPEADRAKLTILYEVSAIAFTFLILFLICLGICVYIHNLNRRRPTAMRLSVVPVVLDFLAGGFPAFRETVKQLQSSPNNAGGDNSKIRPLMLSLNALLVAQHSYEKSLEDRRRVQTTAPIDPPIPLIEQVFSGIITAVLAQLPNNDPARELNTNYMRAVPVSKIDEDLARMVRFATPPFDGCTHILVLERYMGGAFTPQFALPVHSSPRQRLPGAPGVFATGRSQAVLSRTPAFSRNTLIPQATRDEIKAYLQEANFRSFLSVPMVWDTEMVGVLNIEASDEVFNPAEEWVIRTGESLHPYCTILASLI